MFSGDIVTIKNNKNTSAVFGDAKPSKDAGSSPLGFLHFFLLGDCYKHLCFLVFLGGFRIIQVATRHREIKLETNSSPPKKVMPVTHQD